MSRGRSGVVFCLCWQDIPCRHWILYIPDLIGRLLPSGEGVYKRSLQGQTVVRVLPTPSPNDTPSLPYQMALSQALCWEDDTSLAAFVCLLQGSWGSWFSWKGQIYQEDSWGWSNAPNSTFLSWCSEADWCLQPSFSSKLVILSLQYLEWVLEGEINVMTF